MIHYLDLIEKGAEATWMRCRTKSERAAGTTWAELTEEQRDAWRNGTKADYTVAGIPEILRTANESECKGWAESDLEHAAHAQILAEGR